MPSTRSFFVALLGLLLCLHHAPALEPRINEFLADNQHGLSDGDGDEVDWVELYNPNAVALNLSGWYLTDDLTNKTKWQFPAVSMDAKGYLVVFASGKNRRSADAELHTNFSLKADGEVIALIKPDGTTVVSQFTFGPQSPDVSFGPSTVTSTTESLIAVNAPARALVPVNDNDGTNWTAVNFDDASWTAGTLALGYEAATGYESLIGLDVRAAMNGIRTSCYVRIPFTVSGVSDALSLVLRMRYDDGFAVYLNGTLLPPAGRNAPASLAFDSGATQEHDDAEATNFEDIDLTQFVSLLQPGGPNVLAIHGLNFGASSSDFLIGPQLLLQRGSFTNGFMTTPTPGAANAVGVQGFVRDTHFSVDRGFYTDPFTVAITTKTPGTTIRYTRNGDTPTATTGFVYQDPISITGTTTVRAAAFKDGFQPSNVDTHTYLFLDDLITQSASGSAPTGWPSGTFNGQKFDFGMDPNVVLGREATIKAALQAIPTVSIVTDLPNLVDASTGLYVNTYQHGENWERPVSIEILNDPLNPGLNGFQEDGGMRVRGGFSRSGDNPKHSLRLFFRGKYGAGKMKYPLFGDRGPSEFDGFDLRTSQDASWAYLGSLENTFLRDETARETQVAISYGSRCRYFHVYLNGVYWGLYDTDERPNNNYGEQYFGGDKNDYDVIKSSGASGNYQTEASDGTMATGSAWQQLWSGARLVRTNPTNANYFKLMGRAADGVTATADPVLLDATNLADYLITLFYMGGNDGPVSEYVGASNNWFGMRRRGGNTGFRFFIHDFEQSLGLEFTTNQRVGKGTTLAPWSNTVAGANDITRSNPEFLHEDLAPNLEYRTLFGDRVHRHLFNGGAMTDSKVLARMNSLAAMIDSAIWGESARWGDAQREPPLLRSDWLNANARLFSFITNGTTEGAGPGRAATVITQLRGYDNGTKPLYPLTNAPVFSQHGGAMPAAGTSITMSHANSGTTTLYYTVNGADPRMVGGGVNPTALTYAGPIPVSGWTATVRARVKKGANWSALNEAVFVRQTAPPPLRITEIMAAPLGPSSSEKSAGFTDKDDFEFLELTNTGSEVLDLREMRFSRGIDLQFFADVFVAAGERVVVVRNQAAFQLRYGTLPRVVGIYVGSLDDEGERVTLLSALGATVADFSYDHRDPWPDDLAGKSLVLRSPSADPANAANWRASAEVKGSPATSDSSRYGEWKIHHGVSSETMDTDHDGLVPLVEYATGGVPELADQGRFPWISLEAVPGNAGRYLFLSVRHQRIADDLSLMIEQSSNLTSWSASPAELFANQPQSDGTEILIWKVAPAPINAGGSFLRVKWMALP